MMNWLCIDNIRVNKMENVNGNTFPIDGGPLNPLSFLFLILDHRPMALLLQEQQESHPYQAVKQIYIDIWIQINKYLFWKY